MIFCSFYYKLWCCDCESMLPFIEKRWRYITIKIMQQRFIYLEYLDRKVISYELQLDFCFRCYILISVFKNRSLNGGK